MIKPKLRRGLAGLATLALTAGVFAGAPASTAHAANSKPVHIAMTDTAGTPGFKADFLDGLVSFRGGVYGGAEEVHGGDGQVIAYASDSKTYTVRADHGWDVTFQGDDPAVLQIPYWGTIADTHRLAKITYTTPTGSDEDLADGTSDGVAEIAVPEPGSDNVAMPSTAGSLDLYVTTWGCGAPSIGIVDGLCLTIPYTGDGEATVTFVWAAQNGEQHAPAVRAGLDGVTYDEHGNGAKTMHVARGSELDLDLKDVFADADDPSGNSLLFRVSGQAAGTKDAATGVVTTAPAAFTTVTDAQYAGQRFAVNQWQDWASPLTDRAIASADYKWLQYAAGKYTRDDPGDPASFADTFDDYVLVFEAADGTDKSEVPPTFTVTVKVDEPDPASNRPPQLVPDGAAASVPDNGTYKVANGTFSSPGLRNGYLALNDGWMFEDLDDPWAINTQWSWKLFEGEGTSGTLEGEAPKTYFTDYPRDEAFAQLNVWDLADLGSVLSDVIDTTATKHTLVIYCWDQGSTPAEYTVNITVDTSNEPPMLNGGTQDVTSAVQGRVPPNATYTAGGVYTVNLRSAFTDAESQPYELTYWWSRDDGATWQQLSPANPTSYVPYWDGITANTSAKDTPAATPTVVKFKAKDTLGAESPVLTLNMSLYPNSPLRLKNGTLTLGDGPLTAKEQGPIVRIDDQHATQELHLKATGSQDVWMTTIQPPLNYNPGKVKGILTDQVKPLLTDDDGDAIVSDCSDVNWYRSGITLIGKPCDTTGTIHGAIYGDLHAGDDKTTNWVFWEGPNADSNKVTFTQRFIVRKNTAPDLKEDLPELPDGGKGEAVQRQADSAGATATYSLDFAGFFSDWHRDGMTYKVAIDGGDPQTLSDTTYSGDFSVGQHTLLFTATDDDATPLTSLPYTVELNVTAKLVAVSKITLPETFEVTQGQTATLTAQVTPADATNPGLTWSSSDPSVATVDAAGVVTGVKVGKATVTATAADGSGVTASSEVTVKAPEPLALTATPTPTISGSAVVGEKLTAIPGDWAPAPVALAFQWLRNGLKIDGATDSTYVVSASDLGSRLSVSVTGSKDGYSSASKTSEQTGAIGVNALATAIPKISGALAVGSTVTAVPGSWTHGATFSYQWYANGKAVSKATKPTLKLAKAQSGKKISVRVTGSLAGYTTMAKTSAVTAKVTTAGTPTISGKAKVRSTLKAKTGKWASKTKFSYKWLRNGVVIPKASKASYKVTKADVGAAISVQVTGKKSGYATVVKVSKAKAKVS